MAKPPRKNFLNLSFSRLSAGLILSVDLGESYDRATEEIDDLDAPPGDAWRHVSSLVADAFSGPFTERSFAVITAAAVWLLCQAGQRMIDFGVDQTRASFQVFLDKVRDADAQGEQSQ